MNYIVYTVYTAFSDFQYPKFSYRRDSALWHSLRRSRSFKVTDISTNRKSVCDFLLAQY